MGSTSAFCPCSAIVANRKYGTKCNQRIPRRSFIAGDGTWLLNDLPIVHEGFLVRGAGWSLGCCPARMADLADSECSRLKRGVTFELSRTGCRIRVVAKYYDRNRYTD